MRAPAAAGERASRVPHPTAFEKGAILLLVGFLLVFPKGGIKVAGVPLTWGYIALALVFLWFPLAILLGRSAPVAKLRLLVPAMLLPFQAAVWMGLLANGIVDFGFAISLVVTFFFIPWMMVLILGIHLDRIDLRFLFGLIRVGVFAVSVYGIFLFFYRLKTGSFIEIPYLTVNAGDVGALEDKFIDRGGVFKLISTYNNGNIYGVSILILLPLYAWLERSPARQLVVKFALLLTLSRTVWAGLILYEILQRLYVRRISLRTVAVLAGSLAVVLGGLWYALNLMGWDMAFLFDRRLGGRIGQLSALETATVLPGTPFEAILEIVYLSVLHNFGIVGLAAFLVGMTAPVLLHLAGALPFSATEYKRGLVTGLVVYLVVAMSDGALLFIPVMVFYWFVVSLLLSGNPSFLLYGERESAAGASAAREARRTGGLPAPAGAGA
ncbi:MAG TPA: hypothetical protein VGR37_03815 [Longimicrobiaceae bacterium]|nr:hypothetical protein [Longimicrobiaceae bacterium]